jgi:hypothetical protein
VWRALALRTAQRALSTSATSSEPAKPAPNTAPASTAAPPRPAPRLLNYNPTPAQLKQLREKAAAAKVELGLRELQTPTSATTADAVVPAAAAGAPTEATEAAVKDGPAATIHPEDLHAQDAQVLRGTPCPVLHPID